MPMTQAAIPAAAGRRRECPSLRGERADTPARSIHVTPRPRAPLGGNQDVLVADQHLLDDPAGVPRKSMTPRTSGCRGRRPAVRLTARMPANHPRRSRGAVDQVGGTARLPSHVDQPLAVGAVLEPTDQQ